MNRLIIFGLVLSSCLVARAADQEVVDRFVERGHQTAVDLREHAKKQIEQIRADLEVLDKRSRKSEQHKGEFVAVSGGREFLYSDEKQKDSKRIRLLNDLRRAVLDASGNWRTPTLPVADLEKGDVGRMMIQNPGEVLPSVPTVTVLAIDESGYLAQWESGARVYFETEFLDDIALDTSIILIDPVVYLGPTETPHGRIITYRFLARDEMHSIGRIVGEKYPPNNPYRRTWTSSSGDFTLEAELIGRTQTSVTLEKRDGTEVTIELSKLSKADRDWLKDN